MKTLTKLSTAKSLIAFFVLSLACSGCSVWNPAGTPKHSASAKSGSKSGTAKNDKSTASAKNAAANAARKQAYDDIPPAAEAGLSTAQ